MAARLARRSVRFICDGMGHAMLIQDARSIRLGQVFLSVARRAEIKIPVGQAFLPVAEERTRSPIG